MSLVGVFAQTFLLSFALSAPALAYSEEEGQDMFRRGLYEEAILQNGLFIQPAPEHVLPFFLAIC